MKYVRFCINKEDGQYGILEDKNILEISDLQFKEHILTSRKYNLSEVKIITPVVPSKVIALGFNYKDLVGSRDRYDEPIIFFKSSTSVIGPNDNIILPETDIDIWAEVELTIVIGKHCSNVTVEEAEDYIFGYTIGNDVTMRNILGRDHHLARSKACDTFCPLGPFIETDLDTSNLRLQNKINDKLFQDSTTQYRILKDCEIVSLISNLITLMPGDVILSGAPAGAEDSKIKNGDKVTVSIDKLGELTNFVVKKEKIL